MGSKRGILRLLFNLDSPQELQPGAIAPQTPPSENEIRIEQDPDVSPVARLPSMGDMSTELTDVNATVDPSAAASGYERVSVPTL